MEDINFYYQERDNSVVDENNINLHNSNKDTNNRPDLGGGSWYEDGNDKDVQELDKAVELTKILSLKPLGFLDIVT